MKIGGQKVMMPPKIEAVPTQAAWNRYGDLEDEMVHYAYASPLSDLALPTFDRLSRSLLKLATLLAAERQSPNKENRIEVDVQDINNAAWYIQRWGQHSCDLITQSGVRASDRMIKKVRELIERNPGILRGEIMRRYNLNKKEADLVLDTLEEQGYVRKERSGNGFRYFPV
jgi:ribosomal protein S25